MVRANKDSSMYGALPLVKINNSYRKAYSIGYRPKNSVTNANAAQKISGTVARCHTSRGFSETSSKKENE